MYQTPLICSYILWFNQYLLNSWFSLTADFNRITKYAGWQFVLTYHYDDDSDADRQNVPGVVLDGLLELLEASGYLGSFRIFGALFDIFLAFAAGLRDILVSDRIFPIWSFIHPV